MKLRINCTCESLKKSANCTINYGQNCWIAHAVIELFPHAEIGSIGIFPFFNLDDKFGAIALPYNAINAIDEFDNSTPEERLQMSPFSFEIEVPDEVIERIGISQVNEILSKSKNLERV
jgi:hypothetical protein